MLHCAGLILRRAMLLINDGQLDGLIFDFRHAADNAWLGTLPAPLRSFADAISFENTDQADPQAATAAQTIDINQSKSRRRRYEEHHTADRFFFEFQR